jgi:hypothetical protein
MVCLPAFVPTVWLLATWPSSPGALGIKGYLIGLNWWTSVLSTLRFPHSVVESLPLTLDKLPSTETHKNVTKQYPPCDILF